MKFPLGQVVATPAALAALAEDECTASMFLLRHVMGDWGDVCDEDWQSNELALEKEGRLLSVYTLKSGAKIWIITEWDRSVTTVLLPDDY